MTTGSGSSEPTWEFFPLPSSRASHPPLFLRRDFTATSYSIYVTDLTHIWGETLTKTRIHDRADDSEASIDPSTDESQLGILLSKLHDGLAGGGPACNGTVDVELDLRKSDSSDDNCQIHITTREELQKPLRPLVWKFRLRPLAQEQITSLVMLPALAANSLLSKQVSSLLEIIRDKDENAQRMLNKLRELKTDMRSVFPGRKSSANFDELVRFDLDAWRDQMHQEEEKQDSMVDAAFGMGHLKFAKKEKDYGRWWTVWSGKQKRLKKVPDEVKIAPSTNREPTLVSESSFERMKTPPPKRASPVKAQSPAKEEDDDETTDDDFDTDEPRHASKTEPADSDHEAEKEDNDMAKEENVDSSATAMGDAPGPTNDDDEDETTEDEDEPEEAPPPKKKTGGIKGKIGGKKTQLPDIEMESPNDSDDEDVAPPPPKKKGGVMKTIGGKKHAVADADANQTIKRKVDSDDEENQEKALDIPPARAIRSKTRSKTPEQLPPEDVADRKRAELARKLEAQRKAPQKKARKF